MVLLGVGIIAALAVAMSAAGLAANRLPLADPPGLLARLSVYLTRNVAETGHGSGFPELAPLSLQGDPEFSLERIADAFRSLGWEDVALDLEAQRVTAVVRSRVFGFRDDVEATLVSTSPERVTVQVRLASRIGRGDLGANTRHVMDLREQLEASETRRGVQGS